MEKFNLCFSFDEINKIISFQNHEQNHTKTNSEMINQNSAVQTERKTYAKHLMCSFYFEHLNRMKDSREPSKLQEVAELKGARMQAMHSISDLQRTRPKNAKASARAHTH